MNFSDVFNCNSKLCRFSPNGVNIAHVDGHYKLFIRSSKTLSVIHMFTCLDEIGSISWSYDSSMVLCAMYKRAVVQIFSIEDLDWSCKIDEGSYGLVSAVWSSDDQSVLTTSEFNLRITVWSLTTKSVSYIKYPKQANPGLEFSDDGQFMALAERRDFADFLSVFLVNNWSLTSHFQVESSNLQAIKWAPDSVTIAVLDTCTEVRLLFYSVLGHLVSKLEPYQNGLGLKTLTFSPTGQFAAAGFYDQSIHLIPHLTWKSITKFVHPTSITQSPAEDEASADLSLSRLHNNDCATIYKETDYKTDVLSASPLINMQPSGPIKIKQVKYELVSQRPFDVPYTSPDPEKPNPKLGPGLVSFSANGMYMLSRNDNQPCTLYIWNVKTLSLDSVLQHNEPITAAQWDPVHCRLALVTGTPKVFMWSPSGCVAVRIVDSGRSIPAGIDIRWHPEGEMLMIVGKQAFFLCYILQSSSSTSSSSTETATSKKCGKPQMAPPSVSNLSKQTPPSVANK